jgi:hypothetical protein
MKLLPIVGRAKPARDNATLFNFDWGGRIIQGLRPSPRRGRLRRSNPLRGFVEPLGSNPAACITSTDSFSPVITQPCLTLAGAAGLFRAYALHPVGAGFAV